MELQEVRLSPILTLRKRSNRHHRHHHHHHHPQYPTNLQSSGSLDQPGSSQMDDTIDDESGGNTYVPPSFRMTSPTQRFGATPPQSMLLSNTRYHRSSPHTMPRVGGGGRTIIQAIGHRVRSVWKKTKVEDVNKIDRLSRLLFPSVFILCNVIYWCYYYIWAPAATSNDEGCAV